MKIVLLINSIVNKVLAPAFAIIQKDLDRMKETYCMVLKHLSFLVFPCIMVIGVLSYPTITLIYGKEYIDAAPLTSILAIWAAVVAIGNPVGNLIIASGRTDLSFKYVWVRFFLTLPFVWITSLYSIQMVAWGQVFLSIFLFYIAWIMEITPIIRLDFIKLIKSFSTTGILTLSLGVVGFMYFYHNPWNIGSTILQCIIYGIIIAVVYLLISFLFQKSEFIFYFSLIKNAAKKCLI